MFIPKNKELIHRMIAIGRVATLDIGTRILIPYPDDVFLADTISQLYGKDIHISLNPYGKYDLIICYRPLGFNQEQDTCINFYAMLKTNGRLITLCHEASLKVKKDVQERFNIWFKKVEGCIQDTEELGKDYKVKMLVIDRLEYVPKEDPGLKKVRIYRTAKYKINK